MKLAYLELCGFRGYQQRVRIEFASRFTIIDGRNGAGKSTIFDAIEYALTGSLSKYRDAKADGETVADYLWWTGEGKAPQDRYVEVGFRAEEAVVVLRREQFKAPTRDALEGLTANLCDVRIAPKEPLVQLCDSSIIRDEHITSLSLDMKETDRYALLRNALGASDADTWISRAAQLVSVAKRRTTSAQSDVTAANADAATAARRLDEVRARLSSDVAIGEAVDRLRRFTQTSLPVDQLSSAVRERLASLSAQSEKLAALRDKRTAADAAKNLGSESSEVIEQAVFERDAAIDALAKLGSESNSPPATDLAEEARNLIRMVELGRKIGLRDDHCPLCSAAQSRDQFAQGLKAAEAMARRLDETAARYAELEQARELALGRVNRALDVVSRAEAAEESQARASAEIEMLSKEGGIASEASIDEITKRLEVLRQIALAVQSDLRIIDTLRLSGDMERAQKAEADCKERVVRAQERYGRALKSEGFAQALHDAARRAASETLDLRLERVLPLMSEFYRRLRPHPFWTDIEYSIRGDVRRFLKLQVGEDLNPQFLFSSGQRRATGLAFLLSVNLSLAWSKWRSILMDDPVQHVDDFRTVHLAELTAQLVNDGRQIVCAVEDAALADLLCRRLPVEKMGEGGRITLGPRSDGTVGVTEHRQIAPVMRQSMILQGDQLAAL